MSTDTNTNSSGRKTISKLLLFLWNLFFCKLRRDMWSLEKYARWDGNCWHQVDSDKGQLRLLVENMQLLVVQNGTVYESVCLAAGAGQVRGVWKDGILVIVIKHQTTSRRFRVKFTATDFNSALSNCRDCVTMLSQYVSIYDPTESSTTQHVTISDWYGRFMKAEASSENTLAGCLAPEPLPPEFPLEKTVQLCVLDPSFLELVSRVDTALQQIYL